MGESRAVLEDQLVDDLVSSTQPVVLRGPAGIGKSYLSQRVLDRVAARDGQGQAIAVRRISGGAAQRHIDFGALLHLLPVDAPPVTAEFELVQRVRYGLVAQQASTVVVVDDVGMLDAKSAGVIESLIRSGDITVLATERTAPDGTRDEAHHLTAALRDLARSVIVAPLSAAEVDSVLDGWLGVGEVGSIRRLVRMSEGNPLALRELVASATALGAISSTNDAWHLGDFVPSGQSLEELVASHLERLTESEWDLLRAIAIAGEVPSTALRRLDASALEQLQRSALVDGDPCRLAHPLYAEVIRGQTGREERRRLYSKLATSVLPDEGVDPARLGQWMLESGGGVDERTARAGAAVAIGRWENVLAQRLIESLTEPRVADLVQLQWAHANEGELGRAAEIADRAVRAASSESECVDAGLARAELWCLQLGRSVEGYEQLGELRSALTQPNQIARVDGATSLYMRMTGKGSLADSSTSSATSEEVTSDPARLSVVLAASFAAVFRGAFDESIPLISEGYELAERAGEPHNTVRLGILDGVRHLLSGEFDLARETVDRWLRVADVSMMRPAHAVWLALSAQVAAMEGDLSTAILRGREAVRAADHVDDFGSGGFVRGELRAALIEAGMQAEVDPGESPLGRARADLRLASDDVVDARAAALARHAVESGYVMWAPWIAMEAVRRGAAVECAPLTVELARDLDGPLYAACAAHASGVQHGDVDALGDAADGFLAVGACPAALDAVLAMVATAARSGSNDVTLRRHLLVARSLAAGLRPNPNLRSVIEFEQLSMSVEMPSERQLEIARLAAVGRSSKDIAAELIVSVRTVDNHLAAVYRTLGLAGRGELAGLPL